MVVSDNPPKPPDDANETRIMVYHFGFVVNPIAAADSADARVALKELLDSMEPIRTWRDVIVRDCQDVTLSSSQTCVKRLGLTSSVDYYDLQWKPIIPVWSYGQRSAVIRPYNQDDFVWKTRLIDKSPQTSL
jgi:hypothetical protein